MLRAASLSFVLVLTAACSSTPETGSGGAGRVASCGAPCATSNIQHLVVLIQENHTFETHFGRYCQAEPGSSPTCNDGPACCEGGPDQDPGTGTSPTVIDDVEHGSYDPTHTSDCEVAEINGGKMDGFVNASCGSAHNFAYADPALVAPYWDIAKSSALADRYFQPIAGASSSNDMYLARAGFVFLDNEYEPKGAVGAQCSDGTLNSYPQPTIGDLLNGRGVSWTFYAEGYDAMAQAESKGSCPKPPADCPAGVSFYPCVYDPGDVPFQYFDSVRSQTASMRDLSHFTEDLTAGTLPSISYLKVIGYKTEHPGSGTKLSTGVAASVALLDSIAASSYAPTTLVLLMYDEGGGYFDHIAPPPASPVDGMPYGTRLPFLAIGPFARKNFVSHVVLEHSSIVKFIEWNWLEGKTGQLGQRDTVVANLGSLLDPTAVGENVPD